MGQHDVNTRLNIGMVDVDLLNGGTRHPNLAQMKMSAYCKRNGHNVTLLYRKEQLTQIHNFDYVLVSKVFDNTPIPPEIMDLIDENIPTINTIEEKYRILNSPSIVESLKTVPESTKILIGGTGFFEDGGRNLDPDIENGMPDYELYSQYVSESIAKGRKPSYFADYVGCSIGFLTRGCFRKCGFCVNKKYKSAFIATDDIFSFHKPGHKVIYLWDDNFLAIGRKKCLDLLDKLIEVNVPFQFRQGLDIRLMTEDVAAKLAKCKYHGDFIFAFDHIQDKDIIENKLALWRKYVNKETKLYVLCGYDARANDPKPGIDPTISVDERDLIDIENTFERISILMQYRCLPYIMRYKAYDDSPYRGIYIALSRWCNQPALFKRLSFKEFCESDQRGKSNLCASMRSLELLKRDAPHIFEKYASLRYSDSANYLNRKTHPVYTAAVQAYR